MPSRLCWKVHEPIDYTTGRTAECGNGSRPAACAVAARVLVAKRAQASEIVDVGRRKTATVYRLR